MDFLDPKKKRGHTIRLYIGYGLIALLILFITYFLIHISQGYGFDARGNVYQNGLVFVASTPDAAEVRITAANREPQKAVTSDRLTLPADTYTFEYLKQGYRPWQRTVALRGGGIQRLVYPLLFPEKLKTADVQTYDQPSAFNAVDPSREVMVVQQPEAKNVFDVYEANNPTKAPRQVSLATSVWSRGANSTVEAVEWSANSRYLLLKHSYANKMEFILMDLQNPANSVNITKRFDAAPSDVRLRDRNQNQAYVLLGTRLLLHNVPNESNAEVLRNVVAFQPHGNDNLLYATSAQASTKKQTSIFIRRDSKSFKIREVPKRASYLLDMARYNNRWYAVVGATGDDHAYIYRDPFEALSSDNPDRRLSIRTIRLDSIEEISFSANSQFIAAQRDEAFVVYDALADEQYRYEFETPFDTKAKPATWMDGHRLMSATKNQIVIFDFDGSNYQKLSKILPGTTPMFDGDYERMFSLAPSVATKDRSALTVTELRVTQ